MPLPVEGTLERAVKDIEDLRAQVRGLADMIDENLIWDRFSIEGPGKWLRLDPARLDESPVTAQTAREHWVPLIDELTAPLVGPPALIDADPAKEETGMVGRLRITDEGGI